MHEDFIICNCKNVSYHDVLDALQKQEKIEDVLSAFDEVQSVTHCSSGCGGCKDKIVDAISDAMYGYDTGYTPSCNK